MENVDRYSSNVLFCAQLKDFSVHCHGGVKNNRKYLHLRSWYQKFVFLQKNDSGNPVWQRVKPWKMGSGCCNSHVVLLGVMYVIFASHGQSAYSVLLGTRIKDLSANVIINASDAFCELCFLMTNLLRQIYLERERNCLLDVQWKPFFFPVQDFAFLFDCTSGGGFRLVLQRQRQRRRRVFWPVARVLLERV